MTSTDDDSIDRAIQEQCDRSRAKVVVAWPDNLDRWQDGMPDTHRKYGEILRGTVKHRLKNLANDAERTTECIAMLIRDNHNAWDELEEAETLARGLLLQVLLLQKEAARGKTTD